MRMLGLAAMASAPAAAAAAAPAHQAAMALVASVRAAAWPVPARWLLDCGVSPSLPPGKTSKRQCRQQH
eukprot:SM011387S24175  [mRNA]  locus=s11387:86:289:+ [translate_table: standard]